MDLMLAPLRRYADFRRRASRREYWLFMLFLIVASAIVVQLDIALGLGGSVERTWDVQGWGAYGMTQWQGGLLTKLFSLAMLIPSLAVAVRRLHDADHSGWWVLFLFVPLIGWITLLIFYVQPSWPVSNRWGAPAAPRID